MRVLGAFVLLGFAALLLYAASGLPPYGTVHAPPHRGIRPGQTVAADYYIRHAYEDAHTPNIVTVVLADYRGFDTLGETIVVFTGGVACLLLLRRRP